MRRLAFALLFTMLAACRPAFDEPPQYAIRVTDSAQALGEDVGPLFTVEFCGAGEDVLVSDLEVEISSHTRSVSTPELKLGLTRDARHDGFFGPGDVLTVSQKMFVFWEDDADTYKVQLYRGSRITGEKLGEADWVAR